MSILILGVIIVALPSERGSSAENSVESKRADGCRAGRNVRRSARIGRSEGPRWGRLTRGNRGRLEAAKVRLPNHGTCDLAAPSVREGRHASSRKPHEALRSRTTRQLAWPSHPGVSIEL
jgi:hypothetical protein